MLDDAGNVVDTISKRQYDRLAVATYTGDDRTAEQRRSDRARLAGYRSYGDYRRQEKVWGPKADKWTMRMYEAGVPESKLGPLSRARHNAILVEQARAQLPRDVLGNRASDREDQTGILTDPEGPLADILVLMGYRERDESRPPGESPGKLRRRPS